MIDDGRFLHKHEIFVSWIRNNSAKKQNSFFVRRSNISLIFGNSFCHRVRSINFFASHRLYRSVSDLAKIRHEFGKNIKKH